MESCPQQFRVVSLNTTMKETRTYTKRLKPLFRHWDDREIATQLIRLFVLYEDLRIEYDSFYESSVPHIDSVHSRAYRRMWVLRRVYTTVYEIQRAIDCLDRKTEFQQFMEKQRPADQQRWKDSVKFFHTNKRTITTRRHQYGGHFDEKAADYVRDNMDDDTTGEVVIRRDVTAHTAKVVLKFAMELIGQATIFDRKKEEDLEAFVRGSHKFLNEIMENASRAVEMISYGLVWDHFGIEREKAAPEIKDTRRLRAELKRRKDGDY